MLAGIIDDANSLGEDITDLLLTVVVSIMCIVFVVMTGFRTQSPLKTVVAGIGAAAVMAVVLNMTYLSDKVEDDLKNAQAPAVVVIREEIG